MAALAYIVSRVRAADAGPKTFRDVARIFWRLRKTRAMAKITFTQLDGTEQTVDAENGMTVMEAAIKNMVPGIDADCGGACACATCHVYVEDNWLGATGEREEMEEDMLDFAFDVRDNSRLSCQIKVSDDLDGLKVTVPEKQF